jgi:hypothetical protein
MLVGAVFLTILCRLIYEILQILSRLLQALGVAFILADDRV